MAAWDRMHEIVEADYAIRRERVALDKAIELFRRWGEMDRATLLSRRKKDYLSLDSTLREILLL